MALRLNGSNTGYVELDVPADAGSHTLTLPDGGGSSGQYLQTDGAGGLSWQTVTDTGATWTTLNVVGLAGQSSVSITGIPSTATQIILTLDNVSMAGNFDWGVRAGTSSGLDSSNYDIIRGYSGGSLGGSAGTDHWFGYGTASTGFVLNGELTIYKVTGNIWHGNGVLHYTSGGTGRFTHGKVSLGGTLDRIGLITLGSTFSTGGAYLSYMEP